MCFSGAGKFKDFEYNINIDQNNEPTVQPSYKIALSLQDNLEKDEMIRQGIIAPVKGHSDWINFLD